MWEKTTFLTVFSPYNNPLKKLTIQMEISELKPVNRSVETTITYLIQFLRYANELRNMVLSIADDVSCGPVLNPLHPTGPFLAPPN